MVTSVMTQMVSRLLLLPTLVAAAAVLVKGYVDTGDGFNAGVIAALGVLLQYVAFGYREAERLLPIRYAPIGGVVGGLLIALAVAFLPVASGQPILTHSPPPGAKVIHLGTLEILSAVVFDVGVFLLVFGFITGAMRMIARVADRRVR